MGSIQLNLRESLLCDLSFGDYFHGAGQSIDVSFLTQALNDASSAQEQLQILKFFREGGHQAPPFDRLRGVVIEFGVSTGVDVFAAYSDARAYWYASDRMKMIQGDLVGEALKVCAQLFAGVEGIVGKNPPVGVASPPIPPAGYSSLSILSPTGISWAFGLSRDLASDSVSAPVFRRALELRKILLDII